MDVAETLKSDKKKKKDVKRTAIIHHTNNRTLNTKYIAHSHLYIIQQSTNQPAKRFKNEPKDELKP